MSSVYRIDDDVRHKPKRNVFDLSSQNNLTLNFGKIVPVFRKEVVPGDSIKIDPKFALRYMPQVFPVQTRQRASIKYYYVRNRNLWKDWPDFIGRNKTGLQPPYLLFTEDSRKMLAPSTLADYLGYPIHIKPIVSVNSNINNWRLGQPNYVKGNVAYQPNSGVVYGNDASDPYSIFTISNVDTLFYEPSLLPQFAGGQTSDNFELDFLYGGSSKNQYVPQPIFGDINVQQAAGGVIRPNVIAGNRLHFALYRHSMKFESCFVSVDDSENFVNYIILRTTSGRDIAVFVDSSHTITQQVRFNKWNDSTSQFDFVTENVESIVGCFVYPKSVAFTGEIEYPTITCVVSSLANKLCWCDVSLDVLPFASTAHPDRIRLSAFLPLGVETIYNALIRNAENNPLIIDGQPEYNKYLLSNEGGAHDPSHLLSEYYCNWADDRFTTALPSPQQGNAPLVGLTGMQGATLVIGNEDGTQQKIKLQVDSDTGYVMAVDASNSDANPDLVSEAWNAVDYGISINDFRNVNSYQRWKENNIRGGYKYKDQISTHYGVSVRFDVLDMPEFIGGVSRDVNVNQVTQTVQNEQGNLGDIAGQSYIMGEGHSIEQYCDEHGFIVGLLCVYPMPIYQDTLDKTFIKNDPFDFYFPEFSKIGNQPITCKEIAFSQSVREDKQDEVFGYQRPWYEYLESLDEVHGLFQDDLRNFLLARDFGNVPQLGSEFLTLNHNDLNNTFYSLDNKDKIIGDIYHKISMKRPIPLTGIPALE